MNCHLAITRVKFVYLIDACVLRRKLNRRELRLVASSCELFFLFCFVFSS